MIVIPMAGQSRRFFEAGYTTPKYMLPLDGAQRDVFSASVTSFSRYFETESFLFVLHQGNEAVAFTEARVRALGIRAYRILSLERPTAGQAETVERGLQCAAIAADEPLLIFNIDTFRPGYQMPDSDWLGGCAGYLEVFVGEGSQWSFVRPDPAEDGRVAETAEKRAISNLCSTGLYWFSQARQFRAALAAERRAPSTHELYVAPLYNHLIREGCVVKYLVIPRQAVTFCGLPAEYERLRAPDEPR